jgi:Domain of unknown function (DUF4267)
MLPTAYVLAGLIAVGIIFIGAQYIWAPGTTAPGFGFRELPENGEGYYSVKGVRDIASGLIVFTLMAAVGHREMAWVILAMASIPLGDMLTVLRYRGRKAAAFGIHGATAAVMLVVTALLLVG